MKEFVALRPKIYSSLTDDACADKKKGLQSGKETKTINSVS